MRHFYLNVAKYAEENLKGVKVFDNYHDMFASGLIDVVMVETPHYFHPQIAIDAMKAGLNVLCDKPAGVTQNKSEK